MLTVPASLTNHQRLARKRPAISAVVHANRWTVPAYDPRPDGNDAAGVYCPHDADFDPNASTDAARVRNNSGALEYSSGSFGNTWNSLDTVTAGQGLALRYDTVNALLLLAYGDGNDVKIRTSADGGGAWSSSTTIVTEASAIGAVALAVDAATGDACLFYVLGTSTTLKRLRRTSGTWAVAGTTWSKTGSVATLTGVSAVHTQGDYYLAVTGTEVTTTHERCWSVAMGDTALPANAWSTLVPIAEADAAASLTFSSPHLCVASGFAFVSFQQVEAGNVAASRVMLSSVNAAADPLATWREPYPLPDATSAHGVALVHEDTGFGNQLRAYGPEELWIGETAQPNDISDRILSCSWRETPASLRVKIELDYHTGDAGDLAVGSDIQLQHGMLSSDDSPPLAEYGATLLCNIDRITRRFETGKATVTIEASGPWEQMARYRAPQAWTAPAATTRARIFQRIAGKAGLTISEAASPFEPSTAWTTDTPAFALAPGETGAASLRRLLADTPDFLRSRGADGGFEICGFAFGDEAPTIARYRWPSDNGSTVRNPFFAVTTIQEREPNWFRAQGPDRYADSFAFDNPVIADQVDYTSEPIFELVRDISASTDDLAAAAAANTAARSQHLQPFGELVAPLQSAHELYDVVSVTFEGDFTPGFDGGDLEGDFRVIGRGVDFKRGPAGGPVYNTVLQLGRA